MKICAKRNCSNSRVRHSSDNSAEKGKAALSLLHVLISFNEFRQADYNLPAVSAFCRYDAAEISLSWRDMWHIISDSASAV